MEPTLTYKDFLLESRCPECIGEKTKEKIHELCKDHILREAMEYHNDDDPNHTYEDYIKECMGYMNEMLGAEGYQDLEKQLTN
jgi:hypothetical protein